MSESSCRARWVERGAKPEPAPKKMADAWTYHACPPRFMHSTGWRFPLFVEAITNGILIEHARVLFSAQDVSDLEGLLTRWMAKNGPKTKDKAKP